MIDAVSGYFRDMNANSGGAFATSAMTDDMAAEAHAAVADLLGAASPDEIKFGANMSTLTLHIGRSIGATLQPGDEIVVTRLDHEANVSTWRAMAADRGVTVQTVDINDSDVTLDLEDLESKLGPRTKLVAVGYASNAVGSVNPVREIVARAHEVGALTFVDAVAFAPHGPIDVVDLDTDFLACSAYKWFGPHVGVLYGKADILARLPAYKVRPAHDRFETGTPNYEGIAGTLAATDYLRDVGRNYGDVAGAPGAGDASERRRELVAGMVAIADYERALVTRFIDGLEAIAGVTIHGITDRSRFTTACPDRGRDDRRHPPAGRRRGARAARDLHLGRRLLRDRPDRATRQGRDRRRPAPRARPLQHRRRGRPDPRGGGAHRRWPADVIGR